MNAMNAINAMTKKQNNATTCNQPNDATKVTPAHYEELEELQLESVAGGIQYHTTLYNAESSESRMREELKFERMYDMMYWVLEANEAKNGVTNILDIIIRDN
jgi:hypothetical protein